MQFISFIASTMLIVLVSQQSTMACKFSIKLNQIKSIYIFNFIVPVNTTVVEESCSKGFEMIQGQCIPINSKSIDKEIESSSVTSEKIIIHADKPVVVEDITVKSGACPEGMEHGEHGICQEMKFIETTEFTIEATTDIEKNLGVEEVPKGCPEGAEPDEQGACQEIKPSNLKKVNPDPKSLLKKDGSCPDNYKMIEGRCLFIKPKKNLSYSTTNDNISNGIRPKSSTDDSVKFESVPVLSDNSCPEGTEYSEYGICQKRILVLTSDVPVKADGRCPDNFEIINGKCSPKKSKVQNLLELTTKISKSESTTIPNVEPINDDKPISTTGTTTVEESHAELQSKATSAPL